MLVNILQQILLLVKIFTSVPLVDILKLNLSSWLFSYLSPILFNNWFWFLCYIIIFKYAISTFICFIATHKRLHDFLIFLNNKQQ